MESKAERNNQIAEIRKANPYAFSTTIGKDFGISSERVRQILRSQDLPTGHQRQTYTCPNCHSEFHPRIKNQIFCSKKCYTEHSRYPRPLVVCEQCGRLFPKPTFLIKRSKHHFCSRQCFGSWVGKNFGLAAYPENIGGNKRKWDYNKVYKMRDETGWGSHRLSQALGISSHTIDAILAKREKT